MYENERIIFQEFQDGLQANPVILEEFLAACRAVNLRFNTAIYENRFIVGGVVEQLLGATMRAVGIEIDNVAKTSRGVDLYSSSLDVGLSVKAQFKKAAEFRLVNTMGGSGANAVWTHATLADPELASEGLLPRSDVLVLKTETLKNVWLESPQYLVGCDVPAKPEETGLSRVASDVVAQDIMIDFRSLLLHYRPER